MCPSQASTRRASLSNCWMSRTRPSIQYCSASGRVFSLNEASTTIGAAGGAAGVAPNPSPAEEEPAELELAPNEKPRPALPLLLEEPAAAEEEAESALLLAPPPKENPEAPAEDDDEEEPAGAALPNEKLGGADCEAGCAAAGAGAADPKVNPPEGAPLLEEAEAGTEPNENPPELPLLLLALAKAGAGGIDANEKTPAPPPPLLLLLLLLELLEVAPLVTAGEGGMELNENGAVLKAPADDEAAGAPKENAAPLLELVVSVGVAAAPEAGAPKEKPPLLLAGEAAAAAAGAEEDAPKLKSADGAAAAALELIAEAGAPGSPKEKVLGAEPVEAVDEEEPGVEADGVAKEKENGGVELGAEEVPAALEEAAELLGAPKENPELEAAPAGEEKPNDAGEGAAPLLLELIVKLNIWSAPSRGSGGRGVTNKRSRKN
eukprot:RCo042129